MQTADSVLVATPTVVYVLIADRAQFDKIDAPQAGNEKLLAKSVQVPGGLMVIFQHSLA